MEHKLPLLMAAVLAFTLSLSLVVTFTAVARSIEGRTLARLLRAAREVAASAQLAATDRNTRAAAVAAAPEIRAFLREPIRDTTRPQARAAIAALQPITPRRTANIAVEIWDRQGRVVLALPGAAPASRPTVTPETGKEPITSPMFRDGDRVLSWSIVPVQDGDTTIGYVAHQVRITGPRDGVRSLRELTGEDVTVFIRNADAAFWARAPGEPAVTPERVVRRSARLGYTWPGEEPTIAAEAEIGGTPWVTVLVTPARITQTRAWQTMVPLVFASAVLVVLGALLSWLIGRRITRPVVALSRVAIGVAKGDYSRRVAVSSGDEIGQLASTFNRMAAEIEQSRAELELRVREAEHAMVEARRVGGEAERARLDAERANRAKSEFLAVMSHELRTPLNAIAGYTQLLEMEIHGPVTQAQREALTRIERNQAHLLTLINDILNYARLNAARVEYSIQDVAVNEALAELEPLVAPQVRSKAIVFEHRLTDAEICARADRDKLQQIVLNLVSNAIKFTERGGSIVIESEARDGAIEINVCDTGIGIPADRTAAIFDPFVQLDRALNRPRDGVGLGLSISRDLARGMGGELTVESELGRGSVFTLRLPRAMAAAESRRLR
jgi:signal transduction histidine kinase